MKKFDGIWNAEPHKRYKNFVATIADTEKVWLHKGSQLSVWPEQEYALRLYPRDEINCLDVHDFSSSILEKNDAADHVCVFPNGIDSFLVPAKRLLRDIQEELARIE